MRKGILLFFLGIGILASSAWAKMDLVDVMEKQYVRPNILLILDTSGSMRRDVNGLELDTLDSKGRIQGDHIDSRMSIAKEVITEAINETKEFVNLGLMSFKQTHFNFTSNQIGYFPYYRPALDSSITETLYFSRQQLDQAKYTVSGAQNQRANSGPPNFTPVNSFIYHGVTYTLKSSNNSKYRRWSPSLEEHLYIDRNYNAYQSVFQDPNNSYNFTWTYQGSYYEYTRYDSLMTPLDHEMQYYDSSAGKVIAWVRVPLLKHDEDTVLYIFYGNSSISSPTENPSAVWDQQYEAVLHLQESGSGNDDEYKDSTGNGHHGTGGGLAGSGDSTKTPYRLTGKFGYCQSFHYNGTDDLIRLDAVDDAAWTGVTVEAWLSPDDDGDDRIFGKNWGTGHEEQTFLLRKKGDDIGCRMRTDLDNNGGYNFSGLTYGDSWYHVATSWNASDNKLKVYKNGVKLGETTLSGTHLYATPPIDEPTIGNLPQGGKGLCGEIQEVRLSKVARSDAWMKTSYNNQNAPSTFYTVEDCMLDTGDFSRCKKITIHHEMVESGVDLYDFPLLVDIQDTELSTSNYVTNSNGYDILFKQLALEDLYYFEEYYGKQFVSDGTEDDNGGASMQVDPNIVFHYYPGDDGVDFKYDTTVSWTSTTCPVGAKDYDVTDPGGVLLVPLSFSTDQSVQDEKVNEILRWMGPSNNGGLIATGYTPTGSTLKNANPDPNYYDDAYSYFVNEVIPNDPLSCRKNFIIFVTDGEPKPVTEGTTAAEAAETLYDLKDITVYMVGFGSDTSGSTTLDTIAQNGGSPLKEDGHYAYFAEDRDALAQAIKKIIFAVSGWDYVTSAPTSFTGSQSYIAGNTALLASCEFPEWKGHLTATDIVNDTQLWDAGEQLDSNHVAYNVRQIFTSDPSTGNLVPFFSSGSPNSSAIYSLGLGASEEEAYGIIEFIAGKDREWRLMDSINCTPIIVGAPYTPQNADSAPGHDVFQGTHKERKPVVYCGANDGMLHCFDLKTGQERFAYVPPDLFPKLEAIYLNKGQPLAISAHVFGVASSPKAFDIYYDGAWKTVLVCGEGPGGYHYFALDITHPSPGDYGYSAGAPFSVLWHTGDNNHNGTYDTILGESWSTPALGKITYDDGGSSVSKYLAFVGSGYDDLLSGDAEGTTFMAIGFGTGSDNGDLIFTKDVGSASTIVDHALVADAMNYEEDGIVTDTYIADTAGRIWHASTTGNPSAWSMTEIYDAGVNQPFFYSPALIRLGSGIYEFTIMVAISGSSEDPNINQPSSTFDTKIYILFFDSTHYLLNWDIIDITNVLIQSTGSNFPQRSRVTCSPVIIRNAATSEYEVLFLIYVPPVEFGCDLGKTYLVVYRLGSFEITNHTQKDIEFVRSLTAGIGKIMGLSIAGRSSVVIGVCENGKSAPKCIPGPPSDISGQVVPLYWKDYSY